MHVRSVYDGAHKTQWRYRMFETNFAATRMTSAIKLCLATLAVGIAGNAAAAADTTRVIIAYKTGASAHIKSAVAAAHGAVKQEISGMDAMAADMPTQALNGLKNHPDVDFVETDAVRTAFS